MANKRHPSTNPSGAIQLHPRMWGRVFEYVDDSLDDLARVKAAGCVLVSCKDLKRILAAGGRELWRPLIESVVAVAPCVGRSYAAPMKPWLPLAALSTNCLHCRDRVVASLDPFYGVRACDVCSQWGVAAKQHWMISERDAKAEYLVTDEDLRKCPGRRGAGPWRYYVERHVNLASARRFGARRTFDMAKIIRSLRMYGGASAARIAEEYLESSPEYCQELLDALVRGKFLRQETPLGKPGLFASGELELTAATVKALREAKRALDEGRMSEEDFKTTKAGLLYLPIYAVAPSCNSGPTGAHAYYDEHTGRWVPHEAHLVCDLRVGQVTRRPSSE